MRRIPLRLPALLLSIFLGAGCADPHIEAPETDRPPVVATALGDVELRSLHLDPEAKDLVVRARFAADPTDVEREFRLGVAMGDGGARRHGFRAQAARRDAAAPAWFEFSAERGPDDSVRLDHGWSDGGAVARSSLRIAADGAASRHTLTVGPHRLHLASGSVQSTAAIAERLRTLDEAEDRLAKAAIEMDSLERARLRALLSHAEFLRWLAVESGRIAGRDESEVYELLDLDRWTQGQEWNSLCDWAAVASLSTSFCLWNPLCGTIFVPSISLTIACGLVTVIETVGDWFGWWD